MNTAPFTPQGALSTITAATTAPAAIQLTNIPSANPYNVEITNSGAADAWVIYADTAANAALIAADAIPTGSAVTPATFTKNGFMLHIPTGTDKIYSIPPRSYFTAMTLSGTAVLYLIAGDGS